MSTIQQAMLDWLEPRWDSAAPLKEGSTVEVRDSLRESITAALGCSPKLGLTAYWEAVSLRPVRRAALEVLGGPEVAARFRVSLAALWPELRSLVAQCDGLAQLEVPDQVTLRPWCDPKTVSTGRIPFVPVASVCQVALAAHMSGRLGGACQELGVARSEDPWTFMERTDPVVRRVEPVPGVGSLASAVIAYCDGITRRGIGTEQQGILSPAHMVLEAAEIDVAVSGLEHELVERSRTAA